VKCVVLAHLVLGTLLGNFKNNKHQAMKVFNFLQPIRRLLWALIIAYMVGIHNFYRQEMDSPDSIVSSIELDKDQQDSAPKV
jgi:hypothetical protein